MVFEPRVSVYRILVFFYTPVTLPLGFEGWVGLAQEDMVQGLSRKVEYFCCGGGGGAYEGEGKSGNIGWN